MADYSYEYILVSVEDRLARIILNRPQFSNAIATDEFGEIEDAVLRLEADPEVGAILDEYGFPQVADVFAPPLGLKPDDVRGYMASDKKRSGDSITLVVPRRIGECELVDTPVGELWETWMRRGEMAGTIGGPEGSPR